jgi:hypothetical protein
MGLQLDLTQLLGLPDHTTCPRCLKRIPSLYANVDIEAPNFNPSIAKINIPHYCCICEHEWIATFKIETNQVFIHPYGTTTSTLL